MPLIPLQDQEVIRSKFEQELKGDIRIVHFTERESPLVVPGREQCLYCRETRQLLEEVTGLSAKLHLEVYDIQEDKGKAEEHGIDMVPATVLLNGHGGRLRYFGIPSGYEFATLIEDIVDVSAGQGALAPGTRDELAKIDQDVHIQVFVTPT